MHDVIIKGGLIADGTGAEARHGDVAIDGGMITEVGAVSGPARRTEGSSPGILSKAISRRS